MEGVVLVAGAVDYDLCVICGTTTRSEADVAGSLAHRVKTPTG